ncbi:ABC transporter ATP-binding protein [Longispora albida]|uniref:ABC transporter ATP-binding protein n=1 Tax=Longispora albida TaxID=203523 RepID=UPI000360BD42|nr:ABC transporter ATP-binding protein [Longispora albida]
MTTLELSQVTVRFGGVVAVDGVTLRHDTGGVVGLIGPNGAGKTTLLNALSGVGRLTSGQIRLDGQVVSGLTADKVARHGVARTFQNLQLFGSLTVLENVLVPQLPGHWASALAGIFGLPSGRRMHREVRATAAGLLDQVGLTPYADTVASSLPYGLQRRVEIARALAGRPRVLLLDEPLAGLSRSESVDLTDLFAKLAADGMTVVLVEHDVASVMSVSSRVLVLDRGALLADGTPAQVTADPAVRTAYLGEEE